MSISASLRLDIGELHRLVLPSIILQLTGFYFQKKCTRTKWRLISISDHIQININYGHCCNEISIWLFTRCLYSKGLFLFSTAIVYLQYLYFCEQNAVRFQFGAKLDQNDRCKDMLFMLIGKTCKPNDQIYVHIVASSEASDFFPLFVIFWQHRLT